jgi:hypothetical protein
MREANYKHIELIQLVRAFAKEPILPVCATVCAKRLASLGRGGEFVDARKNR